MQDKIAIISKVKNDLDYLRSQYEPVKLWGSCPDGDVKFESFMEWLSDEDNQYMVEFMINTAKVIKGL